MSYSITIQLTLFQNLDSRGKAEGKPQYGYRIYSDFGTAEYINVYDSVSDLLDEIKPEHVLDFVSENHPDFYDVIQADGGFNFNDEEISLDDIEVPTVIVDGTYDDSEQELFDGDKEIQEEVEEVLEEAADLLI